VILRFLALSGLENSMTTEEMTARLAQLNQKVIIRHHHITSSLCRMSGAGRSWTSCGRAGARWTRWRRPRSMCSTTSTTRPGRHGESWYNQRHEYGSLSVFSAWRLWGVSARGWGRSPGPSWYRPNRCRCAMDGSLYLGGAGPGAGCRLNIKHINTLQFIVYSI
jgi:hypothetical protein